MLVSNKTILVNGNMSGNLISDKFFLNQVYGYSIQAVYSGSPVGTFKLQGSNDKGNENSGQPPSNWTGVDNWDDVANSSQSITGAGTGVWNFNGSMYRWVRVVYSFTSGTGSVNAVINIKGV